MAWVSFPNKKLCKLHFPSHFHKEHTGNVYSAKDVKLKQETKLLERRKEGAFPAYVLIKTSQRKWLQKEGGSQQ